MSFLSDTQEFTAVVLPELDIEMLALNLQFFRLDDVVHFALRPPSLGSETLKWKKNPRLFRGISYPGAAEQKCGELTLRSAVGPARRVAVLPAQSRLWCALTCIVEHGPFH
jgi:hypothetical protein